MCDCEFNTLGNCSSSAFILIWLFILPFHARSCFYLALDLLIQTWGGGGEGKHQLNASILYLPYL